MSQGRVIIYLEGGLIQEIISCDQSLEIFVHDSDETDDSCEEKMTQIDGKPVYLTKWEVEPKPEALPLFHKLKTALEDSNENGAGQDAMEEADTFPCEVCGKEVENLCGCCGVCAGCCLCTVDLASGYEWTCPLCQWENNVLEVVGDVTCEKCGKNFSVEENLHALG